MMISKTLCWQEILCLHRFQKISVYFDHSKRSNMPFYCLVCLWWFHFSFFIDDMQTAFFNRVAFSRKTLKNGISFLCNFVKFILRSMALTLMEVSFTSSDEHANESCNHHSGNSFLQNHGPIRKRFGGYGVYYHHAKFHFIMLVVIKDIVVFNGYDQVMINKWIRPGNDK